MDDFDVEQQRVFKDKHLKLRLRKRDTRIAYRLVINEYMDVESPQLMVEYLE